MACLLDSTSGISFLGIQVLTQEWWRRGLEELWSLLEGPESYGMGFLRGKFHQKKNERFKLFMIFMGEQQWVCLYRLQILSIRKERSLWEERNRCSFPSSMVVECQSNENFVLSKTEIMPGELISLRETNKVVVPEGTGRWMNLPKWDSEVCPPVFSSEELL